MCTPYCTIQWIRLMENLRETLTLTRKIAGFPFIFPTFSIFPTFPYIFPTFSLHVPYIFPTFSPHFPILSTTTVVFNGYP